MRGLKGFIHSSIQDSGNTSPEMWVASYEHIKVCAKSVLQTPGKGWLSSACKKSLFPFQPRNYSLPGYTWLFE